MKISVKKEGYITDQKELKIILEDIEDLRSTTSDEEFLGFLENVKSYIKTKNCCSVKQKQSIEDCLIKRKIRDSWDNFDNSDDPFGFET